MIYQYSQNYLDKITSEDTCNFLKGVHGWDNHRPLLYLALKLSGTGNILELGCGEGSTNHLHCFGKESSRNIVSYDYNQEWLDKYIHLRETTSPRHEFVTTQNESALDYMVKGLTENNATTVCLVDHSPGERRYKDIEAIANRVDYVVIHDSELAATGYMLDIIWPLYKYRLNINTIGACAALVSNTVDVTKFDGMKLGEFTLETRIA